MKHSESPSADMYFSVLPWLVPSWTLPIILCDQDTRELSGVLEGGDQVWNTGLSPRTSPLPMVHTSTVL